MRKSPRAAPFGEIALPHKTIHEITRSYNSFVRAILCDVVDRSCPGGKKHETRSRLSRYGFASARVGFRCRESPLLEAPEKFVSPRGNTAQFSHRLFPEEQIHVGQNGPLCPR